MLEWVGNGALHCGRTSTCCQWSGVLESAVSTPHFVVRDSNSLESGRDNAPPTFHTLPFIHHHHHHYYSARTMSEIGRSSKWPSRRCRGAQLAYSNHSDGHQSESSYTGIITFCFTKDWSRHQGIYWVMIKAEGIFQKLVFAIPLCQLICRYIYVCIMKIVHKVHKRKVQKQKIKSKKVQLTSRTNYMSELSEITCRMIRLPPNASTAALPIRPMM